MTIDQAYNANLNKWLADEFLNTSHAPRNDMPWFEARIGDTLSKFGNGKPMLFGITGQAGSGKDSALRYLLCRGSDRNLRIRRLAFADPLKQIAKIVGFTDKQLTDRALKETKDEFWGISPRQFLQMCGTEMFRKVWRDDFWTKLMEKQLDDLENLEVETELRFGGPAEKAKLRAIFITDVRFPNEAEFIRNRGGKIISIHRSNNPNQIDNKHDSEKFISEIKADISIENKAKSSDEWSWTFAKRLIQELQYNAFYY